jgi:hypothetical protein
VVVRAARRWRAISMGSPAIGGWWDAAAGAPARVVLRAVPVGLEERDYVVFARVRRQRDRDRQVGRVTLLGGGPKGRGWFWYVGGRGAASGWEDTRDAALEALAKAWSENGAKR